MKLLRSPSHILPILAALAGPVRAGYFVPTRLQCDLIEFDLFLFPNEVPTEQTYVGIKYFKEDSLFSDGEF